MTPEKVRLFMGEPLSGPEAQALAREVWSAELATYNQAIGIMGGERYNSPQYWAADKVAKFCIANMRRLNAVT